MTASTNDKAVRRSHHRRRKTRQHRFWAAAIAPATPPVAPVVPGVGLAAVLTTATRHVTWRAQRQYDSGVATAEGAWSAADEGTNLTPVDREIVADICFNTNLVFERGVCRREHEDLPLYRCPAKHQG